MGRPPSPKAPGCSKPITEIPDVTSSFGEDEFSFTLPRLADGETVELFTYRVTADPGTFISTQVSASWQGKVAGQVTSEPVEQSTPPLPLSRSPEFPFLGLAVGDPATTITWTLQDVPNVHAWLEGKLDAGGIDLAGVQLRGQFGPVKTTVVYNIPLTGLGLSGGYVAEDVFRFGEYMTATWTINGLYAADPALQPSSPSLVTHCICVVPAGPGSAGLPARHRVPGRGGPRRGYEAPSHCPGDVG